MVKKELTKCDDGSYLLTVTRPKSDIRRSYIWLGVGGAFYICFRAALVRIAHLQAHRPSKDFLGELYSWVPFYLVFIVFLVWAYKFKDPRKAKRKQFFLLEEYVVGFSAKGITLDYGRGVRESRVWKDVDLEKYEDHLVLTIPMGGFRLAIPNQELLSIDNSLVMTNLGTLEMREDILKWKRGRRSDYKLLESASGATQR